MANSTICETVMVDDFEAVLVTLLVILNEAQSIEVIVGLWEAERNY